MVGGDSLSMILGPLTLSEAADTIPPRKVAHEACTLRFSGFRCGPVSGTATTCGTNPAVRRISSRYSVFFNLREGPSEDPSDQDSTCMLPIGSGETLGTGIVVLTETSTFNPLGDPSEWSDILLFSTDGLN